MQEECLGVGKETLVVKRERVVFEITKTHLFDSDSQPTLLDIERERKNGLLKTRDQKEHKNKN